MKNNYLIFYKSGKIEIHEEINEIFDFLIKNGTIMYIFNVKKNTVKSLNQGGEIAETEMNIINLNKKI